MANGVKDILFVDGVMQIKNGDIVFAESDQDHVIDILQSAPGHWRQWPKIGANLPGQKNSKIDNNFLRNIRIHLESDGYKKIDVRFIDNELYVTAER